MADPLTDALTEDYLSLVNSIGAELSFAHGWKKVAASRLGISPSYLSKVLSGERTVGLDVAMRAEQRTGLPVLRTYLTTDPYPPVSNALCEIRDRAATLMNQWTSTFEVDEPGAIELARLILNMPMVATARAVVEKRQGVHDLPFFVLREFDGLAKGAKSSR